MLFFVQKKKSTLWKFIPIVLLAACTVLFGVFSSKLSDDNTQRSKSTLERAIGGGSSNASNTSNIGPAKTTRK